MTQFCCSLFSGGPNKFDEKLRIVKKMEFSVQRCIGNEHSLLNGEWSQIFLLLSFKYIFRLNIALSSLFVPIAVLTDIIWLEIDRRDMNFVGPFFVQVWRKW